MAAEINWVCWVNTKADILLCFDASNYVGKEFDFPRLPKATGARVGGETR